MGPRLLPSQPLSGVIDLSIIVVTYNSSEVIEGFLTCLEGFPPGCSWELLVTDNASTDDSADVVKRRFPVAKIAVNEVNRGFAAGVNQAARRATGRYLLLANPDVTWQAGSIDRLIEFLEMHPRGAAVTPRLTFPDGRPQPSTRRLPTHSNIWFSRGTPWGERWPGSWGPWTYTLPDPDRPAKVEAISGTFLLLRRDAFAEVGMLDEQFFMYVEDTDFSKRLWDAGWEAWVEPSVIIGHKWGGFKKRSSLLRRYHRDGIQKYFRKHHPKKRVRNALLGLALWASGLVAGGRDVGGGR